MRVCLVEDGAVADLEPLTLTGPAFDLLLGSGTLGSKIARCAGLGHGHGPASRGAVVRPHLAAIQRERDPHTAVNDPVWLAHGPMLVANARWVPRPISPYAPTTCPGSASAPAGRPAPWSAPSTSPA